MFSFLAASVERLDAVYRDRPYFVGLKARLLAAFNLLILVFVPLNIAKLLWLQPPELLFRISFNLAFALAAFLSLNWVRKGRIELAGSGLVLVALIPIHIFVFLAPTHPEPLSGAMLLFVFDLVMLLLALVFASRPVAFVVLAIIVATHVAFYHLTLSEEPVAGSLKFAADTMLRDGLITMGFVFCLGLTLVSMIAAANRRSDEALRETRAMNENLGRLVAERTRELEAATRRANEASQAKGDFLANMSHEIRTPLNAIIASADLLQHHEDLSPTAAEDARLIAESGDLLLKLLGDILDLSKIEAGQLVIENHPFELAPVAADIVALVSTQAGQGGVRVDFTVDSGISKSFEGDSFRLRQILLNLLSNAIKFTPAGGHVELTVRSADALATPALVRFEVRDTGIGMDEPMVERLFERFAQAEPSTTRRYGGTGLGLSISSRLVELMGGRLEAESAPGEGSVFHFTIPLRSVKTAPGVAATPKGALPRLGLDVLVAEDNATNRKILASQLEKLGCRCTMAGDGEEVLAALRQEPLPDAVLMDCQMPNLDGWETTRRIRGWAGDPQALEIQQRAAALPIIALTAATSPEERTRCLDAGMTDFLPKPAKLADIRRVLRSFANEPGT